MNTRTRQWTSLAVGVVMSCAAGVATTDGLVPMQANSDNAAIVQFGGGCGQGWLDVSGNSTPSFPGGEGIVLFELTESVAVIASPNAGRITFTCHGTVPVGEQAMALDFLSGEVILATLATRDELCEAVSAAWPKACRGKNGPFISTSETVGVECFATYNGVPIFTRDWISVTTSNGASQLTCHFDLDEADVTVAAVAD